MKKPTPSDIKYSQALGPYYFSRNTMRAFSQRMSDFRTEWHDKGRKIVRLYAKRTFGVSERFIQVHGPANEWKEMYKRDLDL